MNLRPEVLRSKEFPLRRQGYDKDMVDEFLRELADVLQAQDETTAAENVFLQFDGGFKSLLQMATEKAERLHADAEADVRRIRAEVESEIDNARAAAAKLREDAEMLTRAAETEAEETLARAGREAQSHRAAAETEAERILAEARDDAIHLVKGAQDRVDHLQMIERSVIDCLSKAGGFVEQAKSWLGADEGYARYDDAMVDLAEDDHGPWGQDPAGIADHRTARGRAHRPEWAPPWWSEVPEEPRAQPVPGNGNGHANGDSHPRH